MATSPLCSVSSSQPWRILGPAHVCEFLSEYVGVSTLNKTYTRLSDLWIDSQMSDTSYVSPRPRETHFEYPFPDGSPRKLFSRNLAELEWNCLVDNDFLTRGTSLKETSVIFDENLLKRPRRNLDICGEWSVWMFLAMMPFSLYMRVNKSLIAYIKIFLIVYVKILELNWTKGVTSYLSDKLT